MLREFEVYPFFLFLRSLTVVLIEPEQLCQIGLRKTKTLFSSQAFQLCKVFLFSRYKLIAKAIYTVYKANFTSILIFNLNKYEYI